MTLWIAPDGYTYNIQSQQEQANILRQLLNVDPKLLELLKPYS